MSSPLTVAAVTSAAALAAGCGAADEEAMRAGDEQATPTSARFTVRGEIEYGRTHHGDPSRVVFTGTGAFDWERNTGRFETRYGDDGDDVEDPKTELLVFPDATYTSLLTSSERAKGKRWVESPAEPAENGTPLLAYFGGDGFLPSNPNALLPFMRDRDEGLELVGSDPVGGVTTAHYRAQIARDRPKPEGVALDAMKEDAPGERVTLEAWVDGDGTARRIRVTMPPAEAPFRVTIELSDFGIPVQVERPPLDEVLTRDELTELCPAGETAPPVEPQPSEETGAGWASYSMLCLPHVEAGEESDE